MHNHIRQYTTQKRESQHPFTTLTPSHYAPTEPSQNIPTPSQSKQSWPVPEYGAFQYRPTPHFSPRLPFSESAGSRRSRFIQQSAVRSGPAQQARPSHATGRLGADSSNNRNATVAPRGGRGDIHTRPSVRPHSHSSVADRHMGWKLSVVERQDYAVGGDQVALPLHEHPLCLSHSRRGKAVSDLIITRFAELEAVYHAFRVVFRSVWGHSDRERYFPLARCVSL